MTFLNSLPNEVLTFFVILSPVKRDVKWAHYIPSSAPQQIYSFLKFPKMTNLVAEILRHEPIFLPFPSLKPQPHKLIFREGQIAEYKLRRQIRQVQDESH